MAEGGLSHPGSPPAPIGGTPIITGPAAYLLGTPERSPAAGQTVRTEGPGTVPDAQTRIHERLVKDGVPPPPPGIY